MCYIVLVFTTFLSELKRIPAPLNVVLLEWAYMKSIVYPWKLVFMDLFTLSFKNFINMKDFVILSYLSYFSYMQFT